ncbi:sodium/proton-translocating pyrophosphatase, partial [bacterium]|nr:sodium/proton-translocating pyrophosphatase [bacterium]
MGQLGFPLLSSVVGLLFVIYLVFDVLKKSQGNDLMIRISKAVQEGAQAFLNRQYTYVSVLVIVVAGLIALAPTLTGNPELVLGWKTSLTFVLGAIVSALAGYVGMGIATRANARTTQAAADDGVQGALGVAISSG